MRCTASAGAGGCLREAALEWVCEKRRVWQLAQKFHPSCQNAACRKVWCSVLSGVLLVCKTFDMEKQICST
eukprot:scaffold9143_cov19-Tisochrysis_lutea.AAC.1